MHDRMNSESPALNLVRWKAWWWPKGGCPPDPAWRYLFASDEQGRDPKQLEAVCSHRRGGKKAVQRIHRQAERFEGEVELAVHRDQPAKQLTAGFRRDLRGGSWEEDPLSRGQRGSAEGTCQENSGSLSGGRHKKEKLKSAGNWETLGRRCCAKSNGLARSRNPWIRTWPCAACVYTLPCNPLVNSVRGEGHHFADEEISSELLNHLPGVGRSPDSNLETVFTPPPSTVLPLTSMETSGRSLKPSTPHFSPFIK